MIDEAALAEARAFNEKIVLRLSQQPSVHTVPPEASRRARREGRSIFPPLEFLPQARDITGVTIRDTDIFDSTYDGIQFKTGGGNMPNVTITNVRIDDSNNGAGILAMSGARGNAALTNVIITNSADGNIVIQPGSTFVITGG